MVNHEDYYEGQGHQVGASLQWTETSHDTLIMWVAGTCPVVEHNMETVTEIINDLRDWLNRKLAEQIEEEVETDGPG